MSERLEQGIRWASARMGDRVPCADCWGYGRVPYGNTTTMSTPCPSCNGHGSGDRRP